MDAKLLSPFIDYFGYLGMRLSPAQIAALGSSLPILQHQMNFQKVFFWGKITAEKDYFIAQGIEKNLFEKRTLVSQDCCNWVLLNPPTAEHRRVARMLRTQFVGDMSIETDLKQYGIELSSANLTKAETEEEQEEELEGGDVEVSIAAESLIFKEEDRISAIVSEINHDTLIVPRGAFVCTPPNGVHENRYFRGLNGPEVAKLHSYSHFRPAEKLFEKSLLQRADLDRAVDFLDSAADDVPAAMWSLQLERGGTLVFLKNLLWPGYAFFHVPGTNHFGSVYMGDGCVNVDLPFMI